MPLPTTDQAWPPPQLANIAPTMERWDAWWIGTPEALRAAYGGTDTSKVDRHAERTRGLLGRILSWWGRTPDQSSERPDQLHIPIAADIARASADLLYAEPPTITAADASEDDEGPTPTQARIDQYIDAGLFQVLATGAELGAALGGRYHRVNWDPAVNAAACFATTVGADAVLPEWRWGRLVAATIWHVVKNEGGDVWRHLERHELDDDGNGLVLHGLYCGTSDHLGTARPLADHPVTAPLATLVDETGALIAGRTPGLCIEYFPNQTPQRAWRKDPIGQHLGRSDFDGVEQLMDAADETYSSLMRDVRLGKGRIVVPAYMLQSNGPGKGATVNLDTEVYEAVNVPVPEDGTGDIKSIQLNIRVEDHLRTIADLAEQIVHGAGYSASTFGESSDGAAMTATEVQARESRTGLTRGRKVRVEAPATARLVAKMLSIDTAVFGTQELDTAPPVVQFGDTVQESALSLAQTVQAMESARAASTATKVTTLHPDWTDTQVGEEVALIHAEQGTGPLTDPDDVRPVDDPEAAVAEAKAIGAKADALGKLVRAGVESEDAADEVGIDVDFTGAVPTSLRLPEGDAAKLEQA